MKGLGFGGLLIGFGAGWIVFDAIRVTSQFFGYFLLLAGALIIASSLVSRKSFGIDVGGLTRGLMIGLLVSLFATSSFDPFMTGWGFDFDTGSYRLDETRTLTGDLTESGAYLDVENFNGPVSVSTWDHDEYSISILIRAKGTSDSEAEERLEDIEFELTDTVVGGVRRLVLRHNVVYPKTSFYAVSVEAKLPADAEVSLSLDSSNGGMTLTDIEGGVIYLDTSNGGIDFEGVTADEINVDTSNGGVRGTLEAPVTYIGTSNGGIHLSIPSTVSGEYELRTSNAGIGLDLSSSSTVGYDVDLSTSNGVISLDLPNLDYSQNTRTRKVAHTVGFSGKAVQITIDASTSNAGMSVDD
jgi:hypothetical protein